MLNKYTARRLWLGLPDRESMTYGVRTSAATANGADTFTTYSLYHVKRKGATLADFLAAGIAVLSEDTVEAFQVWADDLTQAGAPDPVQSYELTDAAGAVWIIERANRHQTQSRWDLFCKKAR